MILVTLTAAAILLGTPALAIIGGNATTDNRYSYIGAVMQPSIDTDAGIRECISFLCTAILVSSTTAITAAECVQYLDPTTLVLRLGLNSPTQHNVSLSKITTMPGFNSTTLENDLAILTLSSPTNSTPAVLPGTPLPSNGSLTILGWGPTTPTVQAISSTLNAANVTIIDETHCATALKPCFSLDPAQRFCSSNDAKGAAAYGDAGGPVLDEHGSVIAIITGNPSCAACDHVGVKLRLDGAVGAFIKSGGKGGVTVGPGRVGPGGYVP